MIVPVNKIESFSVDLALLLATLCFGAFIYFAFLMLRTDCQQYYFTKHNEHLTDDGKRKKRRSAALSHAKLKHGGFEPIKAADFLHLIANST